MKDKGNSSIPTLFNRDLEEKGLSRLNSIIRMLFSLLGDTSVKAEDALAMARTASSSGAARTSGGGETPPVTPVIPSVPSGQAWHPYVLAPVSGDTLYYPDRRTFGVSILYEDSADGSPRSIVTISGNAPINEYGLNGYPTVGSITSSTTGGTILGDKTYYVAVCGVNASGEYSRPCEVQAIDVPNTTNTNTISLNGVTFPAGSASYAVFAATSDSRLLCWQSTTAGAPGTITLSAPPLRSTFGIPNEDISFVRIKAKEITMAGAAEAAITVVDATTVTCPDLASPSTDWTDRVVSIFTDTGPVGNFTVTSYNQAGVFTLDRNPLTAGVGAGDRLVVLSSANIATSTTIGDSGLQTLASSPGKVVRILHGTGWGQARTIISNNSTEITVAPSWSVTPDSTSVFVVEEAGWLPAIDSSGLPSRRNENGLSLPISLENYDGKHVLICGILVDVNGVESPEEVGTCRPAYIFGDAGTTPTPGTGPVGKEYAEVITNPGLLVKYRYSEKVAGYEWCVVTNWNNPPDPVYTGCGVDLVGTDSYIRRVLDIDYPGSAGTTDWYLLAEDTSFTAYYRSKSAVGENSLNIANSNPPAVLTPSIVFNVSVAAAITYLGETGGLGQEYASRATNVTVTPKYRWSATRNTWEYYLQTTWKHPASSDVRLAGYRIYFQEGNVRTSGFDDKWEIGRVDFNSSSDISWGNLILRDFGIDETWDRPQADADCLVYICSIDWAGRINTIQIVGTNPPYETPYDGATIEATESVAPGVITNPAMTVSYPAPGDRLLIETDFDVPVGREDDFWYCELWIRKTAPPAQVGNNFQVGEVSVDNKYIDFIFPPKVTPETWDAAFVSVFRDLSKAPANFDVDGNWVTQGVPSVIGVPIPVSQYSLAYVEPGSLNAAAFAQTVKPISLLTTAERSAVSWPSTLYPAGTLVYDTTDNKLYRVNSAGNAWQLAVTGADIVANSIQTGQIAAGAISTTELYAGEILVGSGTGKPTKIAVLSQDGVTKVAFIGDINGLVNGVQVQSAFQGGYFKTLRVGDDINDPNFSASANGVLIKNVPFTMIKADNISNILEMTRSYFDASYNSIGLRVYDGGQPCGGSDTAMIVSRGLVVYGANNKTSGTHYPCVTVNRESVQSNAGEVAVYGPNYDSGVNFVLISGNGGKVRADGGFAVGGSNGVGTNASPITLTIAALTSITIKGGIVISYA